MVECKKDSNLFKYLHYIHCEGCWFYEFNNSPDNKSTIRQNDLIYSFEEFGYELVSEPILTHSQVKKYLKENFPNHILIKDLFWHDTGPKGSRPVKYTVDRKQYKQKKDFIREKTLDGVLLKEDILKKEM